MMDDDEVHVRSMIIGATLLGVSALAILVGSVLVSIFFISQIR